MRTKLSRRAWIGLAGMAGLDQFAGRVRAEEPPPAISLFDGKTLDGWIQIENSATSLASGGILDPASFAEKLANGPDAMSVYLRNGMPEALRADLAAFAPADPRAKPVIAQLVTYLNQVIDGPSISWPAQAGHIGLRPETSQLLRADLHGGQPARLNKLLLEDAYPEDLAKSASTGWIVKDGAMASIGAGRGVIYTALDFDRFRLTFTMRHVSGKPDHQACVLIFCQRPRSGGKPLDALGGIQFQVPNGGHWDYRPGMNNNGGPEFTSVTRTQFDVHQWSRVEIVADGAQGLARMAVAQPPGSRAIEVLDFHHEKAGRAGPIAWQMHNAGLFDEYKDVTVEVDPQEHGLITVR